MISKLLIQKKQLLPDLGKKGGQQLFYRVFSVAMNVHNAQLGLFDSLMIVELRRSQYVTCGRTEIADTLVEGDEIHGNIALAHKPSGMTAAACRIAFDDLNIVEAEDRTGIAVAER